ncbi:MAG: hypothetical protein ACLGHL_08030 [Actinomycetota bacterium]
MKPPLRTILFILSAAVAFAVATFFVSGEDNDGDGGGTQRYQSAAAVVEALEAEGVTCRDYKRLDAPQESILDFGLCFLSEGHEYESDIYVFEEASARDSWIQSFDGKVGMLVGENWFITNGSDKELKTLQEALGGEIR